MLSCDVVCTILCIGRESGFYEFNFLNSWILLNFKNAHNFILKFSTLILTKNYNHINFFTVTETLDQQWQVRLKSVLFRVRISNSPLFTFNSCFNKVHSPGALQFNDKTYINNRQKNSVHGIGYMTSQQLWVKRCGWEFACKIWKSADAKKVILYTP